MMVGLYIHVPFCLSKCPYCDFYSVKYSREKAEQYKNALIRNIKHYQTPDRVFDTVYFGGGTPILLWREICEIMKHITVFLWAIKALTTASFPPCADGTTEAKRKKQYCWRTTAVLKTFPPI